MNILNSILSVFLWIIIILIPLVFVLQIAHEINNRICSYRPFKFHKWGRWENWWGMRCRDCTVCMTTQEGGFIKKSTLPRDWMDKAIAKIKRKRKKK